VSVPPQGIPRPTAAELAARDTRADVLAYVPQARAEAQTSPGMTLRRSMSLYVVAHLDGVSKSYSDSELAAATRAALTAYREVTR
jgi:hypothetical protein